MAKNIRIWKFSAVFSMVLFGLNIWTNPSQAASDTSTIPCDPVTTAEIQKIYPGTSFVPGAGDQVAFETQLKNSYAPQAFGAEFFKNIISWSKGQLPPEGHQKLRFAINQMEIINKTRPGFSFSDFIDKNSKRFQLATWTKFYKDLGTPGLGQQLKVLTGDGAGYPVNSPQAIAAVNAINAIAAELDTLKMGNCPTTPPPPPTPPAPTKSFGLPVSCGSLSDDEINKLIKSFNLGTFNSTTMSPDARLAFAKKVQDKLNQYSNLGLRTGFGSFFGGGALSGFYLQLARPLAREISGTASDEDHKFIRFGGMQSAMAYQGALPLLNPNNIDLEDKPDFFLDLYKDVGTPQYGDTLKGYLISLGIPEAQSQPLIDQIKTIKFESNCPPTITMKAPVSPDQMVPCGPVTKAEMQTIFPKHTIALQPPAKLPAEITNFETQLNQMFNVKDDVKPKDTQFYQNVMLWANNQLPPARHQLLRYTIEQLKILLGTYAPETFNFKSESEKFANEIGISSAKYWGEFYGYTLANTIPQETGRLAESLTYMNTRLSSPLDPKNKIGPDAQAALLTIIGKLQALKLSPGCPATFAPAPAATPKPAPMPVVTPPAPKPAPKPVVTPPAPKPAPKPVVTPPAPKPTPKPAVTPPAPKPSPAPKAAPKPAATPPASAGCAALTREEIFGALGTTIPATNPPKMGSPESAYAAFDKNIDTPYNRNNSKAGTSHYNLLKKAARGTPLTPAENKALSQKLKRCL